MPPNRPSNVWVQITRHAYYWFRQSPWWLNHQTKSSKSIKKVINYAHSTQKYSSPHANLTKYLMRHTIHAHSTQPYSTPHANLTKYLMRHRSHAHSTQSSATPHANFDQISHETHNTCKVYHQNQFYTPKKQTSKQPTFPTSCRPSGNQVFKQLFVLIHKLQIHANYTSQLRMWPLFSLSNWQLCLIKCPTAQTV